MAWSEGRELGSSDDIVEQQEGNPGLDLGQESHGLIQMSIGTEPEFMIDSGEADDDIFGAFGSTKRVRHFIEPYQFRPSDPGWFLDHTDPSGLSDSHYATQLSYSAYYLYAQGKYDQALEKAQLLMSRRSSTRRPSHELIDLITRCFVKQGKLQEALDYWNSQMTDVWNADCLELDIKRLMLGVHLRFVEILDHVISPLF